MASCTLISHLELAFTKRGYFFSLSFSSVTLARCSSQERAGQQLYLLRMLPLEDDQVALRDRQALYLDVVAMRQQHLQAPETYCPGIPPRLTSFYSMVVI